LPQIRFSPKLDALLDMLMKAREPEVKPPTTGQGSACDVVAV
jgi:hypothetical protein